MATLEVNAEFQMHLHWDQMHLHWDQMHLHWDDWPRNTFKPLRSIDFSIIVVVRIPTGQYKQTDAAIPDDYYRGNLDNRGDVDSSDDDSFDDDMSSFGSDSN